MPPYIPGTATWHNQRRPGDTQLWKTADLKAQKEGPHHTVYWTSGERYQGEWCDNKRQGKGTVIYKNNDKYEGEWAYDMRHGLGTLWIYKGGKYVVRYTGEWSEDAPTGHGTVFEEGGDTYEGGFLAGLKHGRGRAVYGGRPIDGFGGDVYEGHFEYDQKQGPGTMMYANGDVFEGMWAAGLKHGSGTYFYTSRGKRFDGVWQEGVGKAGSYSEIHTPPAGTPGSLPPNELKESGQVLQAATQSALQRL